MRLDLGQSQRVRELSPSPGRPASPGPSTFPGQAFGVCVWAKSSSVPSLEYSPGDSVLKRAGSLGSGA